MTVEALADFHLVGAASPIEWLAPDTGVQLAVGGVALAPGQLHRGQTYTVWSWSPRPTPAQLSRSPARYPAQITSSHAFEVQPGVEVPPFAAPGRDAFVRHLLDGRFGARPSPYLALYDRAVDVVGRPRSPYAAAVALERWFRAGGGFRYVEQPPQPQGLPPLVDFVTRTKAGYCQHFAGAMALMLRYLGIPARVAAGFTQGIRDGDEWKVTDHDAHTWVEVWFAGWGWLPFDPTPGRGTLAGRYTSASAAFNPASVFGLLGERASGTARRLFQQKGLREASVAGEAAKTLNRGVAGTLAAPLGHKRDFLLLVLAGLAALAAAGVAAKNVVRRLRFRTRDPRRIARACRLELQDYLADQGIDVPPGATLQELSDLVYAQLSVDAGRFVAAATEARYAPPGRAEDAAERARVELRRLLRVIRSPADSLAPASRRVLGPLAVIREAVVMAAGEGLRLRPVTERWAKPVLPIDGRAVIATLLHELAAAGVELTTVVIGHLGHQVEQLALRLPGGAPLRPPAPGSRLGRRRRLARRRRRHTSSPPRTPSSAPATSQRSPRPPREPAGRSPSAANRRRSRRIGPPCGSREGV